MISQINNSKNTKLKQLYISQPIFSLKRDAYMKESGWIFKNIFNQYFCFCKGLKCLSSSINQECKYYFYLNLIDNNRNVYKKTDYLLMDFILKKYSSDDVFPIFEEMINKNMSAHYLTENEKIYEKYCSKNNKCNKIINITDGYHRINGEFLEKHLTLILKLKQVLSSVGVHINFINNLFYNIEYITFICIGHGVSFFKSYLYKAYYGPKNFDKILIPDSNQLIAPAIKYGWKEENIIKFNLPRWDRYNRYTKSLFSSEIIKNNSIFIMFTWREIKRRKKISPYYIKNIVDLLNNQQLINNLSKHNLTLYFTLHHKLSKYKKIFKIHDNVKYIEENDISECLHKANLLVTDYSSIIFDIIYRRKPYIIYFPDAEEPLIKDIYKNRCYEIIKSFKSNDFKFENIFFDISSTLNKINYYINNRFQLENKLQRFYNHFNFKNGAFLDKFIDYLEKL